MMFCSSKYKTKNIIKKQFLKMSEIRKLVYYSAYNISLDVYTHRGYVPNSFDNSLEKKYNSIRKTPNGRSEIEWYFEKSKITDIIIDRANIPRIVHNCKKFFDCVIKTHE